MEQATGFQMIRAKLAIAFVILCGMLGFTLSGLTVAVAQDVQQPVNAQRIAINPGDILSVQVFDTPELSMDSVRVSEGGQINLPVLGLVEVKGLNPIQAAVRIESELRSNGLMQEPHVTVSVVEFASQVATILGQIKTPGVYPVYGGRRLLDVIALAGGLTASAGKIVTIIHRDDPHHPVTVRLVQNARSLDNQKNPVILPDDTIDVGKAGIIYILGSVNKPGGFLIDNNEKLSLMQAISLAGGWDKTAALSKVRLIRKIPQGHEQLKLDLKHVLEGRQADVSIKNGDILYVPTSLGKTLAYRGMEAVIASAQSAVVYSSVNGNF
ncbi:MAG TPA: polysaccharide biosynthesis/export family protein [Acidobacteriaceae bacterium]|nr:polysaccharide biosynthesis/export family protein [Acidobacteriaceae bacterium]